jgi:adenylate kinase family enzyme
VIETAEGLGGARRVLVYGVTGSGKTTAAARISAATGIGWTAVDDLTWEPGWVAVPDEEQRRRIEAVCARDSWLLDTAYGVWLDVPLERAQLVVALDYPRWFSLQRLVRRSLARAFDKRPICNGNTETWRALISADSILAWHFRSFARKRERIASWASDPGGPRVLRFTSARELEAWIGALARVEQPR